MRTPLTSRAFDRRMAGAGLMRRPARGGGKSGSAAPAPLTMYGGSGWDSTNRLGTAIGAGLRGAAAGFWDAALVRVDTQSGTDKFAVATFDSTGKGMVTSTVDGWGTVRFRCGDLAGTGFINSPSDTIAAGDVGKVDLWVGVHTGAGGLVRLWTKRVQVGAGTATTGYTVPNPATYRCEIGSWSAGSFPASGLTVFGRVGGVGVPSQAEIEALYDAVKLAGDLVAIPGKTDHLYSVKQDVVAGFPNGLTDRSGTDNMTFWNGASTGIDLETVVNPTFRW